MWIPALVAAAALTSTAPQEAPKPGAPAPSGVIATMYPACSWKTRDGGVVVVICTAWNSCTMTRYDRNGNIVCQINITPDWC
jgi:hypothetical protein